LKFTEKGGSVTIYSTLYRQNGNSYLECQIIDTGIGIKREDKSKLFKLFGFVETTGDMNTRGIGLGLVISKKIVDNFEGTIGFKSQWEKGSNFGFTI
jgi:signal transduction histidine kinase